MTDSKYFTTTRKGEIFELKAELNSDRKDKRKEAVKKVIASMTVGKDVSTLFPDVVNCMQADNLELKKLVYLYLMNYAKTQPDKAIMAVNTFVRDCEDPNPLIRALAVRTIGCIRVDEITAYLCDPLRKCLKDEDPYVRKTAAVCVAKLHDIDPLLVEEQGFLDMLKDLLADSNPMVVANAVAAMTEIGESAQTEAAARMLTWSGHLVNKLLTALNECTEWGQVFILDAVANYTPSEENEAQSMIERVCPRLAHANAAVVLSAVKVIMKLLELLTPGSDFVQSTVKKLSAPLVTLLSSEHEIQYVALRNINLIVQKRPEILKHELKVFFVKYNDPIYVKLEKLDILIRLTSAANIANVLAELKEYATEVDVDFVRKAVRAIGRCAIKVESAAERCVSTLLDLIQTKVNYVVQEAIVVIKDIFRKYPNKYESVIGTLCENLDTLDEPEARASMIWIIGEYAERIDNADELLESFLDGFADEQTSVQLQLLTAVVKLFLKRPTDTQELVQRVLSLATQEADNPDLRDRGYIYWRLLSTDPAAAKQVVLAEKPLISEETDLLEPSLLGELVCHIGSLASVYHRPPSAFVDGRVAAQRKGLPSRAPTLAEATGAADAGAEVVPTDNAQNAKPAVSVIPTQDSLIGDLLDIDMSGGGGGSGITQQSAAPAVPSQSNAMDLLGDGLDSLLGLGGPAPQQPPQQQPAVGGGSGVDALADIFGGLSATPSAQAGFTPQLESWLPAQRGKGMQIDGRFLRRGAQLQMELQVRNNAMQQLSGFAIQFNKNSFGLAPAQPLSLNPLAPMQTATTLLPLHTKGQVQKMEPLLNLQVAVKNNIDVFYFSCLVPIHVLFTEEGGMDKRVFLSTWKDIPADSESQTSLGSYSHSPDSVSNLLQSCNVFTIARRSVDGIEMLYQSMKLCNGILVLAELKISGGAFTLSLKSRHAEVYSGVQESYLKILKSSN
uniref:AP complex subunit beta n=2 Tax=Macrostomum lignano TaxID=282301 RepID=A0A1I8JDE5_9PLAT